MSFTIRTETSNDHPVVYALIEIAFKTAKVSDGGEQDFYTNLNKSKLFIPDLALVAEADNKVVGQILLTRFFITRHDGTDHPSLLLAPISIQKEYRNRGIGTELIENSFKRACHLGFDSVFLIGDPAYYSRFGFRPTTDFAIQNKNNIPAYYVQAVELTPNALKNSSGTIDFKISN